MSQVGPYLITRELGRGGMGVVYLARDGRLDRDVAIKALPVHLSHSADRLARFEREAKVLAQLNHPNIAGIYGLEEIDGAKYLVLEYVPGETLAARLNRGPLTVDDAIELAVQIAAGLEAAHDAGVVHRDLKPGNVIINEDGQAKVLDFGLARSDELESRSSSADSPTMTSPAGESPTMPGVILGTAAYMSPEQARGKRVDKRTDIWSFGVTLYEMLTRNAPFAGETVSDSIGAVLHKTLDFEKLPPGTPRNVRRVLDRCLERDKHERYRDIGDVRIDLLRGDVAAETNRADAGDRRGVPVWVAVVGLLAALGVGGLSVWLALGSGTEEPTLAARKFEVYSAGPDDDFAHRSPQVSPDGMKLAFIQGNEVRIRDFSTFNAETVAELSGVRQLAWSPDGRALALATFDGLYRVPSTGGGVVQVCQTGTQHPFAWTEDDRFVFSTVLGTTTETIGLAVAQLSGGRTSMLLEADLGQVVDYHAVTTIPGTDVLLFVKHLNNHRTPIMAWDGERSVELADFDDQYYSVLAWSPTGHVLFSRGQMRTDLWAVEFNPKRMEVIGEPFLVELDAGSPSVSTDGTLTFVRGSPGTSGELTWVNADGSVQSIGNVGENVAGPIVSPDGTRIMFLGGSQPSDLQVWVRDLERGITLRISSLAGFVIPVAWSPDGREVAVLNYDPSAETGQRTVFLAADGSGATREPFQGLLTSFDAAWNTAVLASDPRDPDRTFSALNLSDMSEIGQVTAARGGFLWQALSPKGDLLLYSSTDAGKPNVFCTRFPSGEGKWQVSEDGAEWAFWSPDGSAVYFKDLESVLVRVAVTRDPEIRFGVPMRVFPTDPDVREQAGIRMAPDGERFITVGVGGGAAAATGFDVWMIERWHEAFGVEIGR
ncbi:MAG: protein kinase [Phycisphaerales bacterium]|nr:protein kinase [Phycisphaerales bacterium]